MPIGVQAATSEMTKGAERGCGWLILFLLAGPFALIGAGILVGWFIWGS